jgi:hypothetical protein
MANFIWETIFFAVRIICSQIHTLLCIFNLNSIPAPTANLMRIQTGMMKYRQFPTLSSSQLLDIRAPLVDMRMFIEQSALAPTCRNDIHGILNETLHVIDQTVDAMGHIEARMSNTLSYFGYNDQNIIEQPKVLSTVYQEAIWNMSEELKYISHHAHQVVTGYVFCKRDSVLVFIHYSNKYPL